MKRSLARRESSNTPLPLAQVDYKQTSVLQGVFLFSFYKWRCNFLEAYLFIPLFILNVIRILFLVTSVIHTNEFAKNMKMTLALTWCDLLLHLKERTFHFDEMQFPNPFELFSLRRRIVVFLFFFLSFFGGGRLPQIYSRILWTSSTKECDVREIFTPVAVICLIVKL